VLHLGHTSVAIKADDDVLQTTLPASVARDSANGSRVVLRGLSGANAGRAISVGARAVIGSDRDADIVVDDARLASRHAAVEIIGEGIWLRGGGEHRAATSTASRRETRDCFPATRSRLRATISSSKHRDSGIASNPIRRPARPTPHPHRRKRRTATRAAASGG
jgi:hypothetical protein